MHIPVLLKEVIEYLDPRPGQNFIDATVGDGGHAIAILERIVPDGKLLAIDRDPFSLRSAQVKIGGKNNVIFVNSSFGDLKEIVRKEHFKNIKGILFDFGMSSSQLENSGRGFSFQKDEILDMRYDPKLPVTAEDVINSYSETQLAEVFWKWGEERKSRQIAKAIVTARRKRRIKTTEELTRIVSSAKARRGRIHPATQIFQALRIEVNQEFTEIEKALQSVPSVLVKGGRAGFITFHSLEDRLIKNWARSLSGESVIKILNNSDAFQGRSSDRKRRGKPIVPSREEIKINPRARSAKLRVVEFAGAQNQIKI